MANDLIPNVFGKSTGGAAIEIREPAAGDQLDNQWLAMPAGYIEGLLLEWVSGSSIRITSGACTVPGIGTLTYAASLTKAGLSLGNSAWAHVYAYLNGSTPDFEVVPAATATLAAPYSGTARTKTSDTTRRYLGSVRTNASGSILKFKHQAPAAMLYLENTNAAPLVLVSSGAATTATTVSAAAAAPVTAKSIKLFVLNFGTSSAFVSLSNSEGPAVPTGYLVVASPGGVTSTEMAVDAAQAYTYAYDAAPAGNTSFHRMSGYTFER